MLVSLKWLKKYIDFGNIDPKILAEKITTAGIEVEGVYKLSEATNCVVGHVLEKNKHPQADKLSICQVDVGNNEIEQIICGAPNIDRGQKVIVSKVGAKLPGGLKIKKAKLRGVESNGMICSLKELGIENKLIPTNCQDGIYVLDPNAIVGSDALEYLGFDDTILDLGLTPNRADCLSILGVAYEVAAILDKSIIKPEGENIPFSINSNFNVVLNTEDCPLYYAKIVKDVKIQQSPQWLQSLLIESGIRPINNVVDVTNFITFELGQPLHAFDYDKLNSSQIVVRNAFEKESIVTLDNIKRELLPTDIVITDGNKAVAVAGVMGGIETEIDENTTNVLLESAIFNPLSVRKTYTRLGLRSESSIRFEKKVDPNRVLYALNRASKLLEEMANGKVDSKLSYSSNLNMDEKLIKISLKKINNILGLKLGEDEVSSIFRRLKFDFVVLDGAFVVTVPSRRLDIEIEEDLIEEVIRIYGYNKLNKTLPLTNTSGSLTANQMKIRQIKRLMQFSGVNEVKTYSLTSEKLITRFLPKKDSKFDYVKLSMPMSEDRSIMRYSLLPSLLEVISYNNARNMNDISIFEVGRQYYFENGKPKEGNLLACAITGLVNDTKWQNKKENVDFFYIKGVLESVFESLNIIDKIEFVQADDYLGSDYHNNRSAYIKINDELIGIIGQVHPSTQKEYELCDTYVFEINLEKLLAFKTDELRFTSVSKYPSVTRDIAIVVNENIASKALKDAIKCKGKKILKSVDVFDVYKGEHVEENKKSIAFSLLFENPNKTLTDEEVNNVYNSIIKHLEDKFDAILRK